MKEIIYLLEFFNYEHEKGYKIWFDDLDDLIEFIAFLERTEKVKDKKIIRLEIEE